MLEQPYQRHPMNIVRVLRNAGARSAIDELVATAAASHRKRCWSLQTREQLNRLLHNGLIPTLRKAGLIARLYPTKRGYMVVAHATLICLDGSIEDVRYMATSDDYDIESVRCSHVSANIAAEMDLLGDGASILNAVVARARQLAAPEAAESTIRLAVKGTVCAGTIADDGAFCVTALVRNVALAA